MNNKVIFNCLILLTLLFSTILMNNCSSTRNYNINGIKTFDPDTAKIPEPDEKREYFFWDRFDYTIFYQMEKPLDLNWIPNELGKLTGLRSKKQADNVNVLDEVPNSSWYTNRHHKERLSDNELRRGPDTGTGPDTAGTWLVTDGKLEGFGAGFFIEDAAGNRYLIKLDGADFPELASSSEVISTKIFYAAGYNVPENYLTWFDPAQLVISENAVVTEAGRERKMKQEDIQKLMRGQKRDSNGKFRALASKFVDGKPVGIWEFRGRRNDDPNDRVKHQHRRELRGLRVISAWLNDADRRAANTLAVYTDDGYIKHYLLDMGSTLGANGANPHRPIHGEAYLIDPRYMILAVPQFGFHQFPWDTVSVDFQYRETGYFESEMFDPGSWVPTHPNPAYEKMTERDALWGVRIVSSFTNSDIEVLVKTGQISSPEAEKYLIRTLIERRDKIIEHWSKQLALLTNFRTVRKDDDMLLKFEDIARKYHVLEPTNGRYHYQFKSEKKELCSGKTTESFIRLACGDIGIEEYDKKKNGIVKLQLSPESVKLGKLPEVILYLKVNNQQGAEIIGITRYN